MDPTSLAVGAAAGAVIGDVYETTKDAAQGIAGMPNVEHGPIELQLLVELVAEIHKAVLDVQRASRPDEKIVQLSTGQPYELKRHNYKHVSMLCQAATSISLMTKIGSITYALNAGWNAFDHPDNSMVTLTSGGPTNVIIHWGEDSLDIPGV